MKKVFFIIIVLFSFSQVKSQTEKGTVELSALGSFGAFNISAQNYEGDYIYFITTSFRLGYYFIDAFQFEPEVLADFSSRSKPLYVLNANFVYNYSIPNSIALPFVSLGYGVGNALPGIVDETSVLRVNEKFKVGCFNAGAGVKLFLNKNFAIRVEYRFHRFEYNWQQYNSGRTYDYNIITKTHKILFGFMCSI